MRVRPAIPKNIERMLWSESAGYCMNPDCTSPQLITNDMITNLAEIAHIIPNSQAGGASAENLILLCRNCHKANEPVDRPEIKTVLRRWKDNRQRRLSGIFGCQFHTFDELSAKVKPILQENYQIYRDYGPHNYDAETLKLWQKFERRLISNNSKLKLLFQNNLNLFSEHERFGNRDAIRYFIRHVDEFSETRNRFDGVRKNLFPWRVLSIFGICEEPFFNEQNINSIQNLISKLLTKDFKVSVELFDIRPYIAFARSGQDDVLFLDDNPRMEQLVFTHDAHLPHKTDLRLDNLVYMLQFIKNSGKRVEFNDISDLTIVTINGVRIKLFYSYILSKAQLLPADLSEAKYVANLHNWNNGPSTKEARDFAKLIEVEVMTSDEFIAFCKGLQ